METSVKLTMNQSMSQSIHPSIHPSINDSLVSFGWIELGSARLGKIQRQLYNIARGRGNSLIITTALQPIRLNGSSLPPLFDGIIAAGAGGCARVA